MCQGVPVPGGSRRYPGDVRDLRGKRVLVTGAARGIGRAVCLRFARAGAVPLLADLEAAALDGAVEAVRGTAPAAKGYAVDVTDPATIASLRGAIHADGGPIDVLVNNAGVVFGGPFLDVPLERHRATFRVNVEGVVAMTHAFLPDLLSRPEAHLVQMASASGFLALPHGSTYAASKWACVGFSESMRAELALRPGNAVGVTTVCPSYVSTGLFEGVRPPLFVPMLTAEKLATKVVTAVLRDRAWVREPWMVKLTPFLRGTLPGPIFDSVARLLGVSTSMLSWKGRG